MRHLFILNPRSFRRNRKMDQVINSIKHDVKNFAPEDFKICISQYPRNAITLIYAYMESVSPEIIVRVYAIGGDGILFDCLNGIVQFPNTELAVVPYGITNNFIRIFGKGRENLFRDIGRQIAASAVPADIIYCGSSYALNFCSIGMKSDAIMQGARINQFLEQGSGIFLYLYNRLYRFAYKLGSFGALFNTRVARQYYDMEIDGEARSGNFQSIIITNRVLGENGADDALDMLLVGRTDFLSLIRDRSIKRIGCSAPSASFLEPEILANKINIRSPLPLFVNLDGEIFFERELTVELIPAAVRIASVEGSLESIL